MKPDKIKNSASSQSKDGVSIQNCITIAVLFLAIVVRVILLDGSFWMDEAAQALQSVRPFSEQYRIPADFQPPLMHYLVHFFSYYSESESWLRQVPLLAGLGMIAGVMQISRMLGLKYGWVGGVLLALSPFHVYFSQELRPYSLAAVWTIWSWIVALWWSESSRTPQERVLGMIGIGFFNLLSWYSMYISIFFSMSQFLWLGLQFRAFKQKAGFQEFIPYLATTIFYLPWVPFLYEQFRVATALTRSLPGWSNIVGFEPWKSLPLTIWQLSLGIEPFDPTMRVWFILMVLGLLGILFVVRLHGLYKLDAKLFHRFIGFISMSAVIPIILVWIVSFWLPILQPKRVMAAQIIVPLSAVLLVQGLEKKSQKKKKTRERLSYFASVSSIGMLGLMYLSGLGNYWTTPSLQREHWRESMQDLRDLYSVENTVVVFGFEAPFAPWEWYTRQEKLKFSTVSFETIPVQIDDRAEFVSRIRPYERILILDYLRDVTDPERLIESWVQDEGYRGVTSYDTGNFGFIRIHERESLRVSLQNEELL